VKPFFKLQTLQSVHDLCSRMETLLAERVPLDALLERTLAHDLRAPCDLPGFARATMDGYAVHSADTFGSAETSPAYLSLAAEIPMGRALEGLSIKRGECAQIATGGMLPDGADAVVMVEHTRTMTSDSKTIEVTKPVAPGTNVLGPTDDAENGQVLLPASHCLRPQDLGLLAALGQTDADVVRRPTVGIISSGDEIVPVDQCPAPGQVRDVNTHTLAALVRQAGGVPETVGLVADERLLLSAAVERALDRCDLTLLSGGSSVGTRDLTAEVFTSFAGAELLVHGVSVAPGKPFIWVRVGEKHLLGLPGQVTSCVIAFHLFVEPMMERLLGREARSFVRFGRREVVLTRGLPAASGRDTYMRVRVWHDTSSDSWLAEPLFGKSGLLRTLVQSQGLVRIPLGHEGFAAGARVSALTFP
jgi:molybdopterin molybdotransferase